MLKKVVMKRPCFQAAFLCVLLVLVACQQDGSDDNDDKQAYWEQRIRALATLGACPRTAGTAGAELSAESVCGTFTVPENPHEPEGRQIALRLMVVPALSDLPEPDPLFLLAGGPGQAATDLAALLPVFNAVRTDRDIILLDQRGTGELSPFDCQLDEEKGRELVLQDPGYEEILDIQLQVVRDCLATMEADPVWYTTDIAMQDLEAVRRFFGYTSVNLWGASYGSRAALAYLQAFEENTRTVIIDAIAPPSLALPLFTARDASASLEQVFVDCAADSSCNTAFPNLRQHYRDLIARLATPEPITVPLESDLSEVGGTLADYEFMNVLRQVLYSREVQRLVPLMIEQAWRGNYRPLLGLGALAGEGGINQGMFLSVICNEDLSLISEQDRLDAQAADYLLDSSLFEDFVFKACELWPTREVPAAYFEPVTVGRPVLIFSGTLDPVTPPSWGELVQKSLPNAIHLVLEGFGHGTTTSGCTRNLMNTFIDTGSLDDLDTSCVGRFHRRPFFVTPGGSELPND